MSTKTTTWEKITTFFSNSTKGITNFLIFILFVVFIKGMFNDKPILKPFEMPSNFVQRGLTGDLMLSLTLNKYKEITQEVYKDESFTNLLEEELDLSASLEKASSLGQSLNSILNIIRKELGFQRNEINIDIAEFPKIYRVYLQFPEELYRTINIQKDENKELEEEIDEIAEKIAFEFIIDQSPLLLIEYLRGKTYDLEDYETYVHKALDDKRVNRVDVYLSWASRLTTEQEHEKAYRKIMEAIELDSTKARNYSELGNHFWLIGNFKKAEALFQKAIHLDSSDVSPHFYLAQYHAFVKNDIEKGIKHIDKYLHLNRHKERGYYIKGILYANMLEQDSISKYIDLMNAESYSPESEADIWASYYGKIGDKDLMIKYAQRGLDYGLPIGTYLKEPPYSNYMEDTDFLAFLEKNKIKIPK